MLLTTLSNKNVTSIPGIVGNVISGSITLDFPYNISMNYTTIQEGNLDIVGRTFTFYGFPLIVKSVTNKIDVNKDIVYSTVQVGIDNESYNLEIPSERNEYEKLEKTLKDKAKKHIKDIAMFPDNSITSIDFTQRQGTDSSTGRNPFRYAYSPKILTYGKNKPPKKKPAGDVEIVNDPENISQSPRTGKIYDFSMNYDNSGPTKTLEKSYYSNGVLMRQEIIVCGFAYSTADEGVVTAIESSRPYYGTSIQAHWKVVEWTNTYFKYQNDIYTGYTKSGIKYTRFAQETDMSIYELRGEDNYNKVMDLYKFRYIPFIESEVLAFGDLDEEFENANNIPKCILEDEYDSATGTMKQVSKPNPDYKPALYVKEKRTYSRCFAKREVPEEAPIWNGMADHIISTGHENKTIERTSIVQRSKNYNECVYSVYRYQESAQDADFKNNLRISGSEQFLGRPPQVQYVNQPEYKDEEDIQRYIVSAGVDNDTKDNLGSINYPQAESISGAFALLKEDEDYNYVARMDGDEIDISMIGYHIAMPGNTVNINSKYSGRLKNLTINFECVNTSAYKYSTTMKLVKGGTEKPSDLLQLRKATPSLHNNCSANIFGGTTTLPDEISIGEGRN